ncbi:MAG: glutathione S-transferase family protein [Pseudomonadota bacterium]
MYELIGTTKSRAFRALWLLEELGLDYTHFPANPRSDEVLAKAPSGKIPVLISDGAAISDSVAIMTFLADHHGALTHPAGSLERARQDAMTNRLNDELDAVLWMAAKHSFALPEAQRVPEVKPALRWEFARNVANLEAEIDEAPYLAGDTPTIPDFLLTHCLGWASNAKFDYDAPKLEALAQRMRAREAYKRTRAL